MQELEGGCFAFSRARLSGGGKDGCGGGGGGVHGEHGCIMRTGLYSGLAK